MNSNYVVIPLALIVALGIGFLGGRMSVDTLGSVQTVEQGTVTSTKNPVGVSTTSQTSSTPTVTPTAAPLQISDAQKKMLQALGIDINKVTPTMIACAEASIGTARAKEIQGGATPSFSEGVKIVACYK